ncbi:uncharacterized protein LOC131877506 [Tigriopus californicus]|uniref:uncharacterized protein LOC131877506 n=1 Tax=Tigriopus californicus TaxID=6832 RepID=UPI0027DA8AF2|nr:uncharacterized protein LOC131877506 [Tigriopus californicus]
MIGFFFLVSFIANHAIRALGSHNFQECLHLNFAIRGQIDRTAQYVSTSVAVDLNHLSDRYSDSLVQEWRRQCLVAIVMMNQTETEMNQILFFMLRVRVNSKSLILPRNSQAQLKRAIESLHRSFEIFLADTDGTLIRFPILGMKGARGQNLHVGHLVVWPYLFIKEDGQLAGTDVELTNIISEHFVFSYKITRFSRILRKTLENGTEIGIFPNMDRFVYDFGIGQLTITLDRSENVDFGINAYNREIGFAGSVPKRLNVFNTIILPFDAYTWFALLLSAISIFSLLLTFERITGWCKHSDPTFKALSLTIGPLLNESQPSRMLDQSRYKSKLFVIGLWLFLGYFMSMAYESNLLATLTFVTYERPIDTPEEVIKSDLTVYALSRTALAESLKFSPNPIYRSIFKNQVVAKNGLRFFGQPIEARNKAVEEGRGFLVSTKIDAQSNPKFRFFSEAYFIGSSSWFYTRGSQVKDDINLAFQRLIEGGILQHLERSFVAERRFSNEMLQTDKEESGYEPITLDHYLPVVLVGGSGMILGVICFILELFFWNFGHHVTKCCLPMF